MDPTGVANKAADNLLSQGTLGTFAVVLLLFLLAMGWTVRGLYRDNQALHSLMFERLSKALAAIEASTAAITETRGTTQALADAVDGLGRAVKELSGEAASHDTDVRRGLENTGMALGGLKERLDKLCGQVERLQGYLTGAADRARGP